MGMIYVIDKETIISLHLPFFSWIMRYFTILRALCWGGGVL